MSTVATVGPETSALTRSPDGILSYLSTQRTNLVPTFTLADDPFGAKGLPMDPPADLLPVR